VNGVAARSTARALRRQRRRRAAGHVAARSALYAVAAGAALVSAAPFAWSLGSAFERSGRPTTAYVRSLFGSMPFPTFVVNTLLIGALVVLVTLVLALPAAYALARLGGARSRRPALVFLLVSLIPPPLLLPALSRIVAAFGLMDSIWSLVLVLPTVTVPVSVWLLAGFLRAVPVDLEEQAMLDGHSRLGAFARVVVPLALPGVVAVAVLALTLAAGEFTYAQTLVWSEARMPVATGLPARSGDPAVLRSLRAGVVLVAVPLAAACGLVLGRFARVSNVGGPS
jgi:multiple sugar transport system permease protein